MNELTLFNDLFDGCGACNADVCERALVAAHSHLPRLANTQLTDGYIGPRISLTIMGACYGIEPQINFEARKEN